MSFTACAVRSIKTGSRVKVYAADGIFEGVVYSFDQRRSILALRNVLNLETGVYQVKLSMFSAQEIERYEVIEESARSCNKKKNMSNCLIDLAFKESASHSRWSSSLDHDYLSASWTLGTKDDAENNTCAIDEKFGESLVMIDDTSDEFFSSLEDIATQSTIGLAVQGISVGRNGQLCLLQIATTNKTYIYDMVRLGMDGFDYGLRALLESEAVQKVVYNCRCLSDMLCHQYDVLLDNVFDIQVAEVVLFHQRHGGSMPRFVGSLAACCIKYLNLALEDVYFPRVRQCSKQQDEATWRVRPATRQMLDAAYKNVVYLLPLRRAMMEAMMADYVQCVDIYLLAHRSPSNDNDYRKLTDGPNLLPPKLIMMLCQEVKRSPKLPAFIDNFDRNDCDPWIHLSHDGISHGLNPATVVTKSNLISREPQLDQQRVVV